MRRLRRSLLVVLLAAAALPLAGGAQSPAAGLLQEGLMLERADGKVADAIFRYERVVADYPKDAAAPQALYRLGLAYEKLANPRAAVMFERLVRSYPDAVPYAAEARARLAAMQVAAAGPFKVQDLDQYVQGFEAWPPHYSRDGRYVAYERDHALRLRRLSNGREQPLFNLKADEDLAHGSLLSWSPDNLRLAVFVRVWAFGVDTSELRIVTIATGKVSTVATVRSVWSDAWSPDGRRFAFRAVIVNGPPKTPDEAQARRTGEAEIPVHVVSIDPGTGGIAALGSTGRQRGPIVWSPDSVHMALPSHSGPDPALRIVNVATRDSRTIPIPNPTRAAQTELRSWKRNGEIVVRQWTTDGSSDVFFLVNPSGGAPRKVCEGSLRPDGERCIGVSDDGRWAVRKQNGGGGGRLVFRDTATGQERPLTPDAVDERAAAGGFSPDCRLFAFTSNRDGRYAVYVVPVAEIPVARPVRLLPTDAVSCSECAEGWWTAEGLMLRVGDFQANLYRVNMDPRTRKPAGAPLRLTHTAPESGIRAFVSPDGRRVAYTMQQTRADTAIAVMDANGARERIVRVLSGPDVSLLGWPSPDELLYGEGPAPGSPVMTAWKSPVKLMWLNVTTGEARVAGPPIVGRPEIVTGRTDIFFDAPRPDRWSVRAIAGGAVRVVPKPPAWNSEVVSPDGRFLVYPVDEAGTTPPGRPAPGEMRLRTLDTGDDRVLARYADSKKGAHQPVAVSHDGRHLLYLDPDRVLRVMNIETSESWPLVTGAPDGVSFGFGNYGAAWSPDGSFVVVYGSSPVGHDRAIRGITYDAVTKLLAGRR